MLFYDEANIIYSILGIKVVFEITLYFNIFAIQLDNILLLWICYLFIGFLPFVLDCTAIYILYHWLKLCNSIVKAQHRRELTRLDNQSLKYDMVRINKILAAAEKRSKKL